MECGALDGKRSSNTLYLERDRGWTGLLIEMDPYFYTQLLGKNRNVWSINACLSPYKYITAVSCSRLTLISVCDRCRYMQPKNNDTLNAFYM